MKVMSTQKKSILAQLSMVEKPEASQITRRWETIGQMVTIGGVSIDDVSENY